VAARLTGELDQLSVIAVQIFEVDVSAEVDGTDPVVRFATMSHPLSGADWRVFSEVIRISLVIAFDADDYVADSGDRRLSGGPADPRPSSNFALNRRSLSSVPAIIASIAR
jgi:hypothetical protein